MLPSRGYFSGIPCVFYSDGSCSRPHCHYRHSEQDARPSSQNGKATVVKEVGNAVNGWSPPQLSMVARMVEDAVDKALCSDPRTIRKPSRSSLIKNTLERVLADPEALKMASYNKKFRQTRQVPSYKPTPISKLTTKHIPVVCAPEKPISSFSRMRSLANSSHPYTNLATNTSEFRRPAFTGASSNVASAGSCVKTTPEGSIDPGNFPTTADPNCHSQGGQKQPGNFYGSNPGTNTAKDVKPSSTPKNVKVECRVLLERLPKSVFEKYANTFRECAPQKSKISKADSRDSAETNKEAMNPAAKAKPPHKELSGLKKIRNLTIVNPSAEKLEVNRASGDEGCSRPNQKFENSVSPPFKKALEVEEDPDDSEPPAKKNKPNVQIRLRVSSSSDPFTRWAKNKKIRQILKKDMRLEKRPAPGSQTQEQSSDQDESPDSNAALVEEDLPEPKLPKRIAHKPEPFKPVPICSEEIKIPSSFRHHFCAAFFNELKKTMKLDNAKMKASEEEFQVARNSKTTKTYKNSCSLLVLKFRRGAVEEVKLKQEESHLTASSRPSFTYGWSLYQSFSSYLLSEEELRENGFPLALPSVPNCAYVDRASRRYSMQQPDKPFHKVCAHCSKEFQVDESGMPITSNDCFFHWGKLRKFQFKGQCVDKFTCCGGSVESPPCEISRFHVWSGRNEDCMDDFAETRKLPSYMQDHDAGIYALDCEMCYTTKGLELARLTVLDLNEDIVFDEVVSLENPVLNYCTRFSGIDAYKVSKASLTFDDVRQWVLNHFYDKTILVGHSLENDLKALKLIHRTIVDTSVTFPHKFGPPNKMSLKHLANNVLELTIQESIDGHDSREDAATCLKLMMKKIQEDSKARKPRTIIGYSGKKK